MIFDTFLFFNELDLLEVHLNTLDSIVDKFVLVESGETHSGIVKPLYYNDNKGRFSKFAHKIIHIVFPKMIDKDKKTVLECEYDQRNAIKDGLYLAQSDDIIILSDLDEIPEPKALKEAIEKLPENNIMAIRQDVYQHYINLKTKHWWNGPILFYYKQLFGSGKNTLQLLRDHRNSVPYIIGGWHYSYVGSPEMVSAKLAAYSRVEYNTDKFKDIEHIRYCQRGRQHLFQEEDLCFSETHPDTWPSYIRENREKFEHLIYKE